MKPCRVVLPRRLARSPQPPSPPRRSARRRSRHRHRRHGPVGPPAGRFLPLRERQVGGQHADPRRSVRLRHLRDAARARPGARARRSSKTRGARRRRPDRTARRSAISTRASWTRRSIESLGITPLNGELAAIARIKDSQATCRRRSRTPRASACGCPSRSTSAPTSATRNNTPCRFRSQASACRIATTTCAPTESFPRRAKPIRPTSPGSSRSANQPDPEGAAARILSLETKIAAKQWDRARNRDRNATYNKMDVSALQASTPHFDWQAYLAALPAGAKDKVKEVDRPSAGLHEGDRRHHRGDAGRDVEGVSERSA